MRVNIPNQITLARLGLAIVFFVLLSMFEARDQVNARWWLLQACFWVFLVAALTDVLDGFLARMMKQVTSFGRIADPVVDKVMVCGAFVFFSSEHFWDGSRNITGVAPWMVVVVLVRELLVSAIRSHSEARGQSFGADWSGKLKMFVQSVTVCVVLGQLAWYFRGENDRFGWVRDCTVWLMVIVTVLSIVTYLRRAYAFLLSSAALGGGPPPGDAAPPAPGPSGATSGDASLAAGTRGAED